MKTVKFNLPFSLKYILFFPNFTENYLNKKRTILTSEGYDKNLINIYLYVYKRIVHYFTPNKSEKNFSMLGRVYNMFMFLHRFTDESSVTGQFPSSYYSVL